MASTTENDSKRPARDLEEDDERPGPRGKGMPAVSTAQGEVRRETPVPALLALGAELQRPSHAPSGSVRSIGEGSSGGGAGGGEDGRSEERVKCLESLVQHLLGNVPMDLSNLRRMSDKVRQRAGPASDVGDEKPEPEYLDDLTLEDENFTVKTLSQSIAHYSGEFSHWNFSQKLRRRLGQCLDLDIPISSARLDARDARNLPLPPSRGAAPPPRKGMKILEYWRATQLQSHKSLVQSVISCLPPRAVASFLVQVYFRHAQVNCFYVEESWLRKKLEFLYEAPGHVNSEDSAWVCSVLMVLAIGTQFAHMAAGPPEDDLSEVDGGDKDGQRTPSGPADTDSDVGVTFYQMASKLIPDIITMASMESVQACLLLAHYALPLDTHGLAYTYLGLGIKMAIQNGMHRRYAGNDLDAWTVETRNRLWWTAYTVERRVSVLHGRPASISATEVDAELPKDLHEFRMHDEVSRYANMSALIDMTTRLGEVANAITLLRRCPRNLQPTYFERIVVICQALHAWWSTLSPDVQNPTPSSPNFRSNAHLKLCLYLNDIFVGRPFIFSQTTGVTPEAASSPDQTRGPNDNPSSATSPSPAPQPAPAERPRNRAALVERAVEAAISTIALLRTLHEATGLARSSYTEFSSCRAALLVMLAQSVVPGPGAQQQQQPRLKAAVEMGMRLIRRMAAGNNVSTQSETSVIEALETAVRRLHAMQDARGAVGPGGLGDGKGETFVEINVRGEMDVGRTGYERFREWAAMWPVSATVGGGGGGGSEPQQQQQQQQQQQKQHQRQMQVDDPVGGLKRLDGRAQEMATVPSPYPGMPSGPGVLGPPPGLVEHSPDSARWMALMDNAGLRMEQLDDVSLFGGFPELGALDGWPGLI
ncbi:putative c6 transcription factor [Diaporthe ampelina]|uniref:Putative c6 transcription factor n=1 Tax=Diaporthe ampelina TaxID=1214573 RepID=A0A0G2F6N8_9PEZI|nr:putative c6 transcription factor [Diaporthe ampelina]